MRKKTSKNRRITESGKIWYYYKKKRKPGPKKKRGPKKKKKTNWVRRTFSPWNFKIVICSNNNQNKYVGRYHNEEEVMAKKETLLSENKKVILPSIRINNGNRYDKINDLKLEYLILKQNDLDNTITMHPNNIGKLVKHKTNNENWIIWDKFPCLKEETFWVYGYDNRNERKDITWIFNNLIYNKSECIHEYLRIYLYNNKLIILNDYNNIDIVICKNKSDGIRLYNTLQEHFCKKTKYILFSGLIKRNTVKFEQIFNLIKEKTEWSDRKIYRASTRH